MENVWTDSDSKIIQLLSVVGYVVDLCLGLSVILTVTMSNVLVLHSEDQVVSKYQKLTGRTRGECMVK